MTLTHNKPCVASHFSFIHWDDRLGAGEFLLIVVGEMAMRQFPTTRLGDYIREYFDHFQSVRSAISDGKCTEVHFQKPSGHFTEVKWP